MPTMLKSQTTTEKDFLNVHPGELLREEFLQPLGLSAYRLAKDTRLPHQLINELLHEKRGISAKTDLHLCTYFGQEPGYWLRVQLAYDLRKALNTMGDAVRNSITPLNAA